MSQPNVSSGDSVPAEAITTAKQLTDAVVALTDRADRLQAYGSRTRTMTWGLIISLVIDVLLTFVIAWSAAKAQSADDQAQQNRQNAINVCRSTNAARLQNKDLWAYLLAIPQPTPPTAEQQRQRALIKAKIDQVFAPRDCSRL